MTFSSELDHIVEVARSGWNNVGIAVGVVQGTQLTYARGFGIAQAGEPNEIGPDTLFQVGSTTKAMAAATLGVLVDGGKLRWSDSIVKHLPGFQLADPTLTRSVSIADALSHRTGVSDRSYLPAVGLMSTTQAVHQLRYAPAEFEFRDSYHYNNLMYAALGQVAEAASGLSWEALIYSRLLGPLKMKRTGISPYEFWSSQFVAPTFLGSAPAKTVGIHCSTTQDLAMPHGFDEDRHPTVLPWQSYDNAAPAGSIISNITDMANWAIFNLNQGSFDGQQLLRRQTLADCQTTHNDRITQPQYPLPSEGYAFGWRRGEYGRSIHLAHGGGIVGFAAYVALLPEKGIGVITLSNGSAAAREDIGTWKLGLNKAITFWVFDRLLRRPARDWNKEFLERARIARQANDSQTLSILKARDSSAPALPISRYVGQYGGLPAYPGHVSVTRADSHLSLSFEGEGAYSARLEPWQGHQFLVHSSPGVTDLVGNQFATFGVDDSRAVTSLTVFGDMFHRIAPDQF